MSYAPAFGAVSPVDAGMIAQAAQYQRRLDDTLNMNVRNEQEYRWQIEKGAFNLLGAPERMRQLAAAIAENNQPAKYGTGAAAWDAARIDTERARWYAQFQASAPAHFPTPYRWDASTKQFVPTAAGVAWRVPAGWQLVSNGETMQDWRSPTGGAFKWFGGNEPPWIGQPAAPYQGPSTALVDAANRAQADAAARQAADLARAKEVETARLAAEAAQRAIDAAAKAAADAALKQRQGITPPAPVEPRPVVAPVVPVPGDATDTGVMQAQTPATVYVSVPAANLYPSDITPITPAPVTGVSLVSGIPSWGWAAAAVAAFLIFRDR